MAGGTTMAEARPSTPHNMSIQKGFWANATIRQPPLKQPIPKRKTALRPKKSASWPSASWNAPAVSLQPSQRVEGERGHKYVKTYVAAAAIHEIWLCVIPRSLPMAAVTITVEPVKKVFVAMAMVAMKTNATS